MGGGRVKPDGAQSLCVFSSNAYSAGNCREPSGILASRPLDRTRAVGKSLRYFPLVRMWRRTLPLLAGIGVVCVAVVRLEVEAANHEGQRYVRAAAVVMGQLAKGASLEPGSTKKLCYGDLLVGCPDFLPQPGTVAELVLYPRLIDRFPQPRV